MEIKGKVGVVKNSGKQKSGIQKGLKCSRCGLRGHIGEDCQVRCYICKRIGHISKKCKQNSNVDNIEQGESRVMSLIWMRIVKMC